MYMCRVFFVCLFSLLFLILYSTHLLSLSTCLRLPCETEILGLLPCSKSHLIVNISLPSFIEVYLIYKNLHIFNVYVLMSLDIRIHLRYHHCSQDDNISITSRRFLLCLLFLFFIFMVRTLNIRSTLLRFYVHNTILTASVQFFSF